MEGGKERDWKAGGRKEVALFQSKEREKLKSV